MIVKLTQNSVPVAHESTHESRGLEAPMIRLKAPQRKKLHNILVSSIDSEDDLRQLLILECDWEPANILEGGTLSARLLSLITWAEKNSQIENLLTGLQSYRPNNIEIQEYLTTECRRSAEKEGAAIPIDTYATVYGLMPGRTLYSEVVRRLGLPSWKGEAGSRMTATYVELGLEISFAGNIDQDPRIELIRIQASTAREMPHGLRFDMPWPQWEERLSAIYGPNRNGPGMPATYEPPAGVAGSRLMVILVDDCIDQVVITLPSPYR